MAKIVQGQLEFMKLASSLSFSSSSHASKNLRAMTRMIGEQQSIYPDTLARDINVRPMIESDTGKVIASVG